MDEDKLEQVMMDFVPGDIDVLLCTSIIESGLDIPNANTLIVDRADRFGLAQLYQLRGRVGRGAARAYAYFLYDKASAPDRRRAQAAGNDPRGDRAGHGLFDCDARSGDSRRGRSAGHAAERAHQRRGLRSVHASCCSAR